MSVRMATRMRTARHERAEAGANRRPERDRPPWGGRSRDPRSSGDQPNFLLHFLIAFLRFFLLCLNFFFACLMHFLGCVLVGAGATGAGLGWYCASPTGEATPRDSTAATVS